MVAPSMISCREGQLRGRLAVGGGSAWRDHPMACAYPAPRCASGRISVRRRRPIVVKLSGVAREAAAAPKGALPQLSPQMDAELSNRWIELDDAGYFIIYVDREAGQVVAEHYTNTINSSGQACDPETGEPLACSGGLRRAPAAIYRGRSAKELTVSIIEQGRSPPAVTRLDHAAYLGRELQRAELALALGLGYEQD